MTLTGHGFTVTARVTARVTVTARFTAWVRVMEIGDVCGSSDVA